jgi:hypothetical protein
VSRSLLVVAPLGRGGRMKGAVATQLLERGYHNVYRTGSVNHCPGCGRSQWHVGRQSAECAFCSTAIPLAAPAGTVSDYETGPGHGAASAFRCSCGHDTDVRRIQRLVGTRPDATASGTNAFRAGASSAANSTRKRSARAASGVRSMSAAADASSRVAGAPGQRTMTSSGSSAGGIGGWPPSGCAMWKRVCAASVARLGGPISCIPATRAFSSDA